MDKWKDFANRWHTDYDFKTFVNSFGSALITLAFAIFNFVLGIKSSSPWHISILSFMTLRNVLKDKSGSSFHGIDIEHN